MRRSLVPSLAVTLLLSASACSRDEGPPPPYPPAQAIATHDGAGADTGGPVSPAVAAARARVAELCALPDVADLRCVVRIAPPYAIVQQVDLFTDPDELRKNAARLATGQQVAARDEILLTELHRRFRELFAERFALPDLTAQGRTLLVFVGWERPGFDQAYAAAHEGEHLPSYYRSLYSRPAQTLFTYLGPESLRAQDEVPVAGGRVQKQSDQDLFFEGTLQLLHEYGAILRGRPLVDGDREVPPPRPVWFEHGLAGFMSGVEVDRENKGSLEGATFRHERLPQTPIAKVVGDGRAWTYRDLAREWTLPKLVRPNEADLLRASAELHPTNPVLMAELFAARSWGLVSFLWNYDGGRYREAFLGTMDDVLQDRHDEETLARRMGLPGADDWGRVEAEYEWYWDRCLARRFGWRDEAHTRPWDTETDPPTGTEEDARTEADDDSGR